MSLFTRIVNALHPGKLQRDLSEEMEAHIADAVANGRDEAEARRAFGSIWRAREASTDLKLVPWLDSLRADAVFGWRRLKKHRVTSAAAILSLALAIGACTSAFRLIDAMLLRPLPVAHPERLYVVTQNNIGNDGKPITGEGAEYPMFRMMRDAVAKQAVAMAISYAAAIDVTYGSDQEMEKAYRQYVSGSMFSTFGLQPAAGRLFTESDDVTPGAHPYAVLSYDYWTRRFARDPNVIGRTFHTGAGDQFQIIGVAPERFTGTEPGTVTSIFFPAIMHPGVKREDQSWTRVFIALKPNVDPRPVTAALQAQFRAFREYRAKGFVGLTQQRIANFLSDRVELAPAAAGFSDMQKDYRQALVALGVLVGLVLLIACGNVANLMTAQAASRSREMALRVSIGAGRARLVQLVLMESAWIAILSASLGALFAWWSAPLVVRMISPTAGQVRLILPADWRVFGFGLLLTIFVTALFGLAPALRASGVKPVAALKGGDCNPDAPHSRRRLMHALIAGQVAFCILVLFVAGLFVATFQRISKQPLGFSADRVLAVFTVARPLQSPTACLQLMDHLAALPGVEQASLSGWPLLDRNSQNGLVAVNGAPLSNTLVFFLPVSPGWISTMRIALTGGRDLLPNEIDPSSAIVNEAFEREFFAGQSALGKSFDRSMGTAGMLHYQIAGVSRDAVYRNVHEPISPTVYVPFAATDDKGAPRKKSYFSFLIRSKDSDPRPLSSMLRSEIARVPGFRVSGILTQQEIDDGQMLRERFLATLALFFAAVALLLAGVGLYGVLDYSVLQRRREIGIRMALGARAAHIARNVTVNAFTMVALGAFAGLALGMFAVRYIAPLFFHVNPTDARMLATPAVAMLLAAMLAALPAVIHAVRIDPMKTLRSE